MTTRAESEGMPVAVAPIFRVCVVSFTPETLLRQWQTLRLIPRYPRRVTAASLHEKLSADGYVVGKRTVERDLQSLSTIFPLVVDERSRPFGWSWDKDAPAFDVPGLSGSEALTLLMARDHLSAVMPSTTVQQLQGYFRQAESRMGALAGQSGLAGWRDKVRVVQPSQPLLSPTINPEIQARVQEALLQDRQCEATYQRRGAEAGETYDINPLGLIQRGQLLYLAATIKTYTDVRLLALHRFRSATLLATPSIRPAGFSIDAYLATGAMGWGPGETVRLEAIFASDAGIHLYEARLSEDQLIEVMPDGMLRVTATIQDTQQLVWWLLGFGDSVEVLAPAELRQRLVDKAQGMVRRYEASQTSISIESPAVALSVGHPAAESKQEV